MVSPSPVAPAEASVEEPALLDRARGGDGAAFATLVTPYLGLLYRVAMRATGNPSTAEDAVQETLEIVYRSLGRYRPGTSFKAFVAKTAVRRARTLLRSEMRRRHREQAAPAREAPSTPADAFEAEEARARIRTALSRLPQKRQRVAMLRLDAGLGYREIADAVGTTEGSARVLVHHALTSLAGELADLLGKEKQP